MVWEHGEESLLEFIGYLNDLHPTIKFMYKYSRDSIEFLDVLIIPISDLENVSQCAPLFYYIEQDRGANPFLADFSLFLQFCICTFVLKVFINNFVDKFP